MYPDRLYVFNGGVLHPENQKKQVEDYYNKIMNSNTGFEKLIEINDKFTEKFSKNLEKNQLFENILGYDCELLGQKSQRLYIRMKQLDFINPWDDIFCQGNNLLKELEEICSLYYFNMEYLINLQMFYYYDSIKDIEEFNKQEELVYKFYSTLVDIFLQKTDPFVEKISDYIKDEQLKILIKQQRAWEKDARLN